MYSPASGRFTTKDSWQGDYNRPLSLNRWNYVEGNPVNHTDPSGRSPNISSQILSQTLSQYSGYSNIITILGFVTNCLPVSGTNNERPQYDLTGYLALAMTKHGQDTRVKNIASAIAIGKYLGSAPLIVGAYLDFKELEGKGKEWDIKLKINEYFRNDNIVLCGIGFNCRWLDYSTPGNIHFGYIAGLANIDHYVAAVVGGWAEQTDLRDNTEESGTSYNPYDCFLHNPINMCDNPQDQAAVDFGYKLARNPLYKNGITDKQLRFELQVNGMDNFQLNPDYAQYWYLAAPEANQYGADYFNQ